MLSILLPTFNEKDNIVKVIDIIEHNLSSTIIEQYEIVVIDDNSPDGTAAIVSSERPQVRVIVRTKDKGLSAAVIEGIKQAKGEIICVLDADLSHPPELINQLYQKLMTGFDMVVASRLVAGGGVEEWPVYRRLMSLVGRMLAWPLTPVKDTMSGYFIFRKECLKETSLVARGYKILLEILVKGRISNVCEVAYIFRNRELGQSKINKNVISQYIIQVLGLYWFKIVYLIKMNRH